MGAGLSLSTGPDRTCFSVVLPVFDVGGKILTGFDANALMAAARPK